MKTRTSIILILLPMLAFGQLRNGTLRNGKMFAPPTIESLPVTGYTLWLHADFLTFTDAGTNTPSTSGDPVGFWFDRSGNNRHVSNTVASLARPWKSNLVWNGHSALYF